MAAKQQATTGRFGRAVVGLHRTDRDAGLLAYVAMLARAEVVSDVQLVHVLADGRDDPAGRDLVLAEMKAEAGRYLVGLPASARVGFDADWIIPDFLREVVLGAYFEGTVGSDARNAANYGGVGLGVTLELQFPYNFVGTGSYSIPSNGGLDLLWDAF